MLVLCVQSSLVSVGLGYISRDLCLKYNRPNVSLWAISRCAGVYEPVTSLSLSDVASTDIESSDTATESTDFGAATGMTTLGLDNQWDSGIIQQLNKLRMHGKKLACTQHTAACANCNKWPKWFDKGCTKWPRTISQVSSPLSVRDYSVHSWQTDWQTPRTSVTIVSISCISCIRCNLKTK